MKTKKISSVLRSLLAVVLIAVMILSMSVTVFAAGEEAAGAAEDIVADQAPGAEQTADGEVSVVGFHRDGRYVDYYADYSKFDVAIAEGSEVGIIDAATAGGKFEVVSSVADVNGVSKEGVIHVTEGDAVTFSFNVKQEAMYAVELTYLQDAAVGKGKDFEIEILFDGKKPFNDSDRFSLKRNWSDKYEEREIDSAGNELFSEQVEKAKWLSASLRDPDGVFDDPAKFYLTPGEHTITVVLKLGALSLDQIRLHNDSVTTTYSEYLNANKGAKDSKESFVLETEKYIDKSESLIQPAFDRSDPKVTPYSINKTRLNVLGGESWNGNGQRVNWSINVPEDGFYVIGVRYRQSYVEGTVSYRKLYIDGEVPFKEAEEMAFPYGIGYQYKVLGGKDGDYKFYLTKGKHVLSMEGVVGPMENVSREAEDTVYQLNYIYRKIIIVTGQNPDTYRDYELDKKIPGLMEMFESVYKDVCSIEKQVIELNGNLGSAQIITTLKKQLEDFLAADYKIPEQLSTFKDNISTLSTWMLGLRNQPLQIDKMVFAGNADTITGQTANFWETSSHEVRAFWSSFVDDYTTVGTAGGAKRSLTVWVGTGRDQATVLKTLCENDFTPHETKGEVSVNVGLVPLTILSKAIVAGRCPDIALHVSRTEPMNLGVRNAVYDLSQFEDFDEVTKRFSTYALTPYTLSSKDSSGKQIQKVFALPESQNFNMMFYRTDIFAELGIQAPQTWDDFDNILPYIQANNMSVGLDPLIQNGAFFTFMLQSGHQPYADGGEKTNFTEQWAVEAFEKWTRYYLQYDLPTDYNWYTYFRNGEMPLVIQPYGQITYLQESAPELNGLWKVAPIPGTYKTDEDGNRILDENGNPIIDRTEESGTLSACMIVDKAIKQADDPEQKLADAWTFMKWWTSAKTSGDYGNRIEMAIGPVARYTTANLEAFDAIKWSSDEAKQIKVQREYVRELPELVGGYYVGRNIINAFRNVTNNNANPREKLFYYNEEINGEIWRKRSEYNLSVPKEART